MESAQTRCFPARAMAQSQHHDRCTNIDIRALDVSSNAVGDGQTLLDLHAHISGDETITSVGFDGTHCTRDCHAAIDERRADPVIPVHHNGKSRTKDGAGVDAQNEALRATNG